MTKRFEIEMDETLWETAPESAWYVVDHEPTDRVVAAHLTLDEANDEVWACREAIAAGEEIEYEDQRS